MRICRDNWKISVKNFKTEIKFRYSEKATKFWNNLPSFLTLLSDDKKNGRFLQIFVAFSEYLNFMFMCISGAEAGPLENAKVSIPPKTNVGQKVCSFSD